ncbi:MAG: hypothetical protein K0R15_2641 [Clostridiales bacterium]|jgi:hypothetical protein|nr:hypothetical protein [Clostridiales bacterium]
MHQKTRPQLYSKPTIKVSQFHYDTDISIGYVDIVTTFVLATPFYAYNIAI